MRHPATRFLMVGALVGASLAVLAIWPAAAQQTGPSKLQKVRYVAAVEAAHTRAHRRRSTAQRPSVPQRQIACTYLGCNPVPSGCHPEPQRTFSGMTTGYDAVACP